MPRIYTKKYTDDEWIEHRKEYVEEYYEEHKDEVARRKHRYYAEKQYKKNGHKCMTCGEVVPMSRNSYHYCSRECYLEAFVMYRPIKNMV